MSPLFALGIIGVPIATYLLAVITHQLWLLRRSRPTPRLTRWSSGPKVFCDRDL